MSIDPTPPQTALHAPHVADTDQDRHWAELLSPSRRRLLRGAGLAGAGLATLPALAGSGPTVTPAGPTPLATDASGRLLPIEGPGRSPWGEHTSALPTPRPASVRPDENALPQRPRAYTQVKSYHAHIYFDEDSHQKAALIRRWTAERFPVELGEWNLEPRGPHVTPSFYFGFGTELLPILVPWLQLNSLGLTILLHPNTGDPRSDHLYYALWVNRSQPVNAYAWRRFVDGGGGDVEQINPNVRPSVALET